MENSKKTFGQFFTNPTIAEFMIKLSLSNNANSFLDPAVGEGIFTSIAKSKRNNIDITACEIDDKMINAFMEKNHYPIDLLHCDYLTKHFDKKFDCIVCNPPYNKFQKIKNRDDIRTVFAKEYGIKMVGYSNICVYFLIKSINEMAENGKCCFIMPYEFLNTGYGVVIKQYLLESKALEAIIKFSNKLSLFDEAITTSCILLLHNIPHDTVKLININDVNEIHNQTFSSMKIYNYSELNQKEKWIRYFDFTKRNETYSNLVNVSEFGKVSRGIATGGNNYFSLNQTMINNYNLSDSVCVPCLTKSPDVKEIVVTEESFTKMILSDKKVFIFDGTRAEKESDFEYIFLGEKNKVNMAYLTSHRSPWYSLEEKKPAPILLSVFNRGTIKVIRNEAMVKSLTTFHGFYLKNNSNDFANLMFCYLLTPLAQKLLYLNKREYGDGLDKFEPGDLNDAVMLDLRVIREEDVEIILSIYYKIRAKQKILEVDKLNEIFEKYTNLSKE